LAGQADLPPWLGASAVAKAMADESAGPRPLTSDLWSLTQAYTLRGVNTRPTRPKPHKHWVFCMSNPSQSRPRAVPKAPKGPETLIFFDIGTRTKLVPNLPQIHTAGVKTPKLGFFDA